MTSVAVPAARPKTKPEKYQPRHRKTAPPTPAKPAEPAQTEKAVKPVPIRIPAPVNALWDAVERNRLVAFSATVMAVSLAAAVWHPHVAVVVVVALTAFLAGLCFRVSALSSERERRLELEAENAWLKAALRKAAAGDATAITQKMLVISDGDGDR